MGSQFSKHTHTRTEHIYLYISATYKPSSKIFHKNERRFKYKILPLHCNWFLFGHRQTGLKGKQV